MVRTAALTFAALANLGTAGLAQDSFYFTGTTGAKLMEVCGSQIWTPGQYDPCGSYLLGLIDGLANTGAICPPNGVGNVQLEQIAFNYVKDNPELWHMPAVVLVRTRLAQLYPC